MSDEKLRKAAKPKKSFVLKERSDVDPHQGFKPEELGMEDWGEGFYVNPEPVVIERNEDGSLKRTTPISEATPDQLIPKIWQDGQIVEAEAIQKPRPAPKRPQEKVVALLAGLLMRYYASLQPGQIAYNPLYDGIPADASVTDDKILDPKRDGHGLVHVSAEEVHSWLKQIIGKRAQIRNAKTGKLGWQGDIKDLVVTLKR